MRSTTARTRSIGIANPTFSADACALLFATAVLSPTTWPAALTSGPPELPELIEASVWISPLSLPLAVSIDRFTADTIPFVTVSPPFQYKRISDRDRVVAHPDP
jgi:hypothetical protein